LAEPWQTMYGQAEGFYRAMVNHPETSYRCGSYALSAMAHALYETNGFVNIWSLPSPDGGFSMAALEKIASENHLDFLAARRISGNELIVPSVVHWKQNHYAAIVAQNGNQYKVMDPTFHLGKWVTADAINAECSGEFLIPANKMDDNWERLKPIEMAQIHGKGQTTHIPPPPKPPCSTNNNCSSCSGMPIWQVSEPAIELWLIDEPLGYQPAKGKRVSGKIYYWSEDHVDLSHTPDNLNVFGLGPKWRHSWLSYIDVGNGLSDVTGGGLPSANPSSVTVTLYPGGGGQTTYTPDGHTLEYYSNNRMQQVTNSSGALVECDVLYPSGAKEVYGFIRTDSQTNAEQAYLTQSTDPQGHAITFVYDGSEAPTNFVVRLLYVVDADGKTNTINYINDPLLDTNLISQVVDPYGRTNHFFYDENGTLTNVADVAGMSSSFIYGNVNGFNELTNLVTPYGTNIFTYLSDPDGDPDYGIIVTEPNGSHQMFAFYNDSTPFGIPASYSAPSNVPAMFLSDAGSTLDNQNYMYYRNSYYFGREQYANLTIDPLANPNMDSWKTNDMTNNMVRAQLRHWYHTPDGGTGYTLSMERDFSQDGVNAGKMTWYNYPGKTSDIVQGSSAFPSLEIKVLPDGTDWIQSNQTDSFGNKTNIVSSYSVNGTVLMRTNVYIYASNGADLLQAIGPDGVTNAAYGYDSYHNVLFMTNAVSDVTSYSYNSDQQLNGITFPTGLIRTNLYNGIGLLTNRYDYSIVDGSTTYFNTNAYTYTNLLVLIHTDERGLTVTNSWDNLQRLTNIAYPDGTSISCVYSNLDLIQVIDRMGYTNSYAYNAIRQKLSSVDALGRTTGYGYCECGALDYITNALNQVTQFIYDQQGNLVSILYPDGYSVTNTYNSIKQLTQKADSSGASTVYSYNNQGMITTISNTMGLLTAFKYDINDRKTNTVDANGVSVAITYDNLGRMLSRKYPDGGTELYAYSPNGLVAYTNQIGRATLYGYDAERRETSETNSNNHVTYFSHDGIGDLLAITNGNNNVTTWNYDIYGRVTNKQDNLGTNIFICGYDADNRLTNRWTPAKMTTQYRYDAVGNLTNVIYTTSSNIVMQYDALNRLTNTVDGIGTNIYTYDAAGQMLSEWGPWPNSQISYIYANRLRMGLAVQQSSGLTWTNGYEYDSSRRLTNIVTSIGSFGYRYASDASPLVYGISLPNGAQIVNSYDLVARLNGTYLEGTGSTFFDGYTYYDDLAGERTNVIRNEAISSSVLALAYDNIGQLTTATGTEAGGSVNRLQEQMGYAYDAAGNLNYRTNDGFVQMFNVNTLNELTTATRSGTFTVAGNTTTRATNVTVNAAGANIYQDYTYAATGFVLTNGGNTFIAVGQDGSGNVCTNTIVANLPATNSFNYDLNGNLLYDGLMAYKYDDENQLIQVEVTNAWMTQFAYDGRMRRRMRTESTWNGSAWLTNSVTRYVYDGNYVIQERDNNNVTDVTYTRGLDLSGSLWGAGGACGLLARTDTGTNGPVFYHADGDGNVTCLIDTNQLIVAKYLYDPYGNLLSKSGILADTNLYRFASKECHPNSGLIYYLYRYYDPSQQRWLNRDPLGEGGDGDNLYVYCDNDPVNQVDTDGRKSYGPRPTPPMGTPPDHPINPYGPRPHNSNPSDLLPSGSMTDASGGAGVGGGVSVITCCDSSNNKIKATFKKYCVGLYLGASATTGIQQGVGGKNCPNGFGGWFIEAGGGLGVGSAGGSVSPDGRVGAPGVGIGLGGGVWMCNYILINSDNVGCCK